MASPDPFSPEMVAKESARRSEIREKIKSLPRVEQDVAVRDEKERQQQWQELWEAHRQPTSQGSPDASAQSEPSAREMEPVTLLVPQLRAAPKAPSQTPQRKWPRIPFLSKLSSRRSRCPENDSNT